MRTRGRNHVGQVPAIPLPVSFEAGKGFVTAVMHIDDSTIGLKFVSPTQLLMFFTALMESAQTAWPDDPYIQMYMAEE